MSNYPGPVNINFVEFSKKASLTTTETDTTAKCTTCVLGVSTANFDDSGPSFTIVILAIFAVVLGICAMIIGSCICYEGMKRLKERRKKSRQMSTTTTPPVISVQEEERASTSSRTCFPPYSEALRDSCLGAQYVRSNSIATPTATELKRVSIQSISLSMNDEILSIPDCPPHDPPPPYTERQDRES